MNLVQTKVFSASSEVAALSFLEHFVFMKQWNGEDINIHGLSHAIEQTILGKKHYFTLLYSLGLRQVSNEIEDWPEFLIGNEF
ncbi:TPA: hypothetical protein DCG61_00660 [Patescibacteria group bacterium]|jgi:hypothetical protein|nr:hypothetical protein [Patescibacteria group bacterium]